MRSKKRLVLSLLLVSVGGLVYGDAKYTPSEVEDLKLKLAVSQAQNAQQSLNIAQANLQQKMSDLGVIVEDVKKAHNWPKETQYSLDTNQFQDPPAEKK